MGVEPVDMEGQLYSDQFTDQQRFPTLYVVSPSRPPWEGYRIRTISPILQMRRLRTCKGKVACPSHTVGEEVAVSSARARG